MKNMKWPVIALALLLGNALPTWAANCALGIWPDDDVGKVVRSSLLRSAANGHTAWSLIIRDVNPTRVSTQLIVRDEQRAQEKTIAVTRWEAGTAFGLDPTLSARGDSFHAICPIDWSPDSRLLLFEETIGPMYSDAGETYYWIYDARLGSVRRIDLDAAYKAARSYWKLPETYYGLVLAVEGWRPTRSGTLYLLVAAYPEPGDDKFLGYWQMRPDGLDLRLITGSRAGVSIQKFGRSRP
ncbi:MAG TPA: hypothetical protein VGV13_13460 [Methylomirabilota bacterium]|jgi:hypothetical protein|nr:hypothetical protein [Methylomirabilota bacterium]